MNESGWSKGPTYFFIWITKSKRLYLIKIKMMTRVRVTYVAMVPDGDYPIMTAHTLKDIIAGVNEYYGISPDNPNAKFLSFDPHITKYPSEYEGDLVYSIIDDTQYIERVKVYCTEFYPHTIYEVNNETE